MFRWDNQEATLEEARTITQRLANGEPIDQLAREYRLHRGQIIRARDLIEGIAGHAAFRYPRTLFGTIGKSARQPMFCEQCGDMHQDKHGKPRLERHHDDYTKPLAIRWLCPKCHRGWHRSHVAKSAMPEWDGLTLAEIGRRFGISRQRVHQLLCNGAKPV